MITGAASGCGRLIAEKCAAGGARVVGVDVDGDGLSAVVDGITAAGDAALAQTADVTDPEQVAAAARAAVETYGAVDVLVNNAGVMPLSYFADHGKALPRWLKAIDINIKGVVNGIVAVLSDSLRRETKGRIKVTTVKPTGVAGTNLASGIVNYEAINEMTGRRAETFQRNRGAMMSGDLPAELTDPDSIAYWLITPDELADAVVHVIDQPWGISISDITVRASGEDYLY